MDPLVLHASSLACNGFLRFTSGVTPADLLAANTWRHFDPCTGILVFAVLIVLASVADPRVEYPSFVCSFSTNNQIIDWHPLLGNPGSRTVQGQLDPRFGFAILNYYVW